MAHKWMAILAGGRAESAFKAMVRLVPGWGTLRRMGESRIFASSFIWLLVVPSAARILELADAVLKAPIWQEAGLIPADLAVSLLLPGIWKLFYIAATFVALGMIVFYWRCPRVIREFRDGQAFVSGGGSAQLALVLYADLADRFSNAQGHLRPELASHFSRFRTRYLMFPAHAGFGTEHVHNVAQVKQALAGAEIPEARALDAFWHIQEIADQASVRWRGVCSALLCAGSFLVVVVGVQGFILVLKH